MVKMERLSDHITTIRYKFHIFHHICLIYVMSLWYVILQYFETHRKPELTDQCGRIALITGGGTGIGFHTSQKLLKQGMTVVIAGIKGDQEEGVGSLQTIYGEKVKFLECDLSSLQSVKEAAIAFNNLSLPLHLLINNAGIMFSPYRLSEDGFESHWIINYLSHFTFTHLLLHHLEDSATPNTPTRVVCVSSCLHNLGTINFDDTQGKVVYSAEFAYTQSKLAMTMFACSLSRHLKERGSNVLANSAHPAVTLTSLYRHVWWAKGIKSDNWALIHKACNAILKSPREASDTVIHAALSPSVGRGGDYFDNCTVATASREARDKGRQERLWQLSLSQAYIEQFGS